jgi:CrcB protein
VQRLLLICLGGALGSGLRYAVALVAARAIGADFPYGTLVVNLTGAFAIGLVQQVAAETLRVPDDLRLFLTTGLLGGLTTYSAFTFETVQLARLGLWSAAVVNVAFTTGACLALCTLGVIVGHWIAGGH